MNALNIIIFILILIIVVYLFYQQDRKPNLNTYQNEKFNKKELKELKRKSKKLKQSKKTKIKKEEPNEELVDCEISGPIILNPNFINNQFHNDYRDVITVIYKLIPRRRQIFNVSNKPIEYSIPNKDEVQLMIEEFVILLNEKIKELSSPGSKVCKGFDTVEEECKVKSGWQKVQESLGLPSSLYEDPSPNNWIRLIFIKNIQKYKTEEEVKYAIEFVLQKQGVEDQMVIKISIIQCNKVNQKINFEDIFIVGFLSKEGVDCNLNRQENTFYDFDFMEKNNLTDPKKIQEILLQKYDDRRCEMEYRISTLDEEGRQFHSELPSICKYQNARSIIDDFNCKKEFC